MSHDNTQPNPAAQHIPQSYIDGIDCPMWGTSQHGKSVKIDGDEVVPMLFSAWQKEACAHPKTCIIRFVNAGGATMHQLVCRDCGQGSTKWLKREEAERIGITTDFCRDRAQGLSNQYQRWRKERLDAIANEAADRSAPSRDMEYSEYLASDIWQRKRSLILRRANYVCEGCLSRPATVVHHLTYNHKFNEFAFELVAICEPCHNRIHGKSEA